VQPAGQLGTFSPQEPTSGRRSWATHRWHRDGANVFPNAHELYEDVPRLFRDYIVQGHAPDAPMLQPTDKVVTLGSCFAQELRNVLEAAQFSSGSFWIPSGLNNTFAIHDFVAWCVTGDAGVRAYRYDRDDAGEIREWTPEDERETYLAHVKEAGAFVFTLGLAEVWTDRETGLTFWRGVPEGIFEEDRHEFRLSTVEENVENVRHTIELIRTVNATAPIILTLSPVPLQATFRDISCVTADCVSKSVLRVALDTVTGEQDLVYYWPSFELVKWGGAAFDWSAYGVDARHVDRYLVECIIAGFAEAFYGPAHAGELRRRLAETGQLSKHPHPLRTRAARARRLPGKTIARARRAPGRLRRSLTRRAVAKGS
jgi:hypothetical protein